MRKLHRAPILRGFSEPKGNGEYTQRVKRSIATVRVQTERGDAFPSLAVHPGATMKVSETTGGSNVHACDSPVQWASR